MAIQNYTDHAANERTFLAWVRTAVAIMGFGFLVERFDLFVAASTPASKLHSSVPPGEYGHIAGLTLIILGMLVIGVAAWRFIRTAKEIDEKKQYPGTGRRTDIALAVLLILLAGGLILYLFHVVTKSA